MGNRYCIIAIAAVQLFETKFEWRSSDFLRIIEQKELLVITDSTFGCFDVDSLTNSWVNYDTVGSAQKWISHA